MGIANSNRVRIGASYYLPHHDRGEWERDFAQMADAGFTVVRTGELLAAWDCLEKEPRKPDFSSLDAAFDLCSKHSMELLLGTGSNSPPAWLLAEHPDLPIVDRDGIAYPSGAMWCWACINHPAYIQESERFLRQLLERYGARQELLGWQIDNESGHPFVSREDRSAPAWHDYNPHTVAAFRCWLEKRYQNIDALNEAWRWVPTCMRHRDFASVPAPRATAAEWGSPAAWLDWRRFTWENRSAEICRQHDLIKSVTPDALTMTNIYGAALDQSGSHGIDSWSLAKQCDAIGYDLYPGMSMPAAQAVGRGEGDPHYPAWFLDFASSTARAAGSEFWLPEMESGPLGGFAAGPGYCTTAADIRRWGLQGLSRGSRMLLYQGYRDWRSLPLNWGGLADWEGEPTGRLDAAAQLARLVAEHPEISSAAPYPSKVAIYNTQANTVFCACCGHADMTAKAMRGMHRILGSLQLDASFISSPQLATAAEHCEVLILPFMVMLSEVEAAQIEDFVTNGGAVITMPRTAMVDDGCKVWPRRPGGRLSRMLGVRECSIEVADHIELVSEQTGRFFGCHHRQHLIVEKDVEQIASFKGSGDPAVTLRRHGEGKAIHAASHLDMAGGGEAQLKFWEWLLVNEIGCTPPFNVLDKASEGLECKFARIDDNRDLLYMANSSAVEIRTSLRLARQLKDAVSLLPSSVDAAKVTPGGEIELCLSPWEAQIVRLEFS